ncbi:hypothetical protein JCM33374_g2271 [Metschnikowia sp. JCM 33374]|nr:hypothetical protein JCM33374_g2271 [Metschnikowia sp. JCM 33374]
MIFSSLVWTAVIAAVSAANTPVAEKSHYTVNLYKSPAFIPGSVAENPFLSVPQTPSSVTAGTDLITVQVPGPRKHYIWEMTGFFQATESGPITFRLLEHRTASIQLGFKAQGSRYFDDLISDQVHSLSHRNVATFQLEKGQIYPLRVVFVAGTKRLPLMASARGPSGSAMPITYAVKTELRQPFYNLERVRSPQGSGPEDVWVPQYSEGDFMCTVFATEQAQPSLSSLQDLSKFPSWQRVLVDADNHNVKPEYLDTPQVVEIVGHFRAPMDGQYNISMTEKLMVGLQVGPGTPTKHASYKVDDTWTILDTRVGTSRTLELKKDVFYPFRLVVVGAEERFSWNIVQEGPDGVQVDLFGLSQQEPEHGKHTSANGVSESLGKTDEDVSIASRISDGSEGVDAEGRDPTSAVQQDATSDSTTTVETTITLTRSARSQATHTGESAGFVPSEMAPRRSRTCLQKTSIQTTQVKETTVVSSGPAMAETRVSEYASVYSTIVTAQALSSAGRTPQTSKQSEGDHEPAAPAVVESSPGSLKSMKASYQQNITYVMACSNNTAACRYSGAGEPQGHPQDHPHVLNLDSSVAYGSAAVEAVETVIVVDEYLTVTSTIFRTKTSAPTTGAEGSENVHEGSQSATTGSSSFQVGVSTYDGSGAKVTSALSFVLGMLLIAWV